MLATGIRSLNGSNDIVPVNVRIAHEHVVGAVQQRVAVGRGVGDDLGGEIAARARPILDDDRLTEANRQRLRVKPARSGPPRRRADSRPPAGSAGSG